MGQSGIFGLFCNRSTQCSHLLLDSCRSGDVALVRLQLQRGADPNVVCADGSSTNGKTCLHIACERGRIDIARRLLNAKASTDVVDECGDMPIHVACRRLPGIEGEELVKVLLQNSANPSAKNVLTNCAPLHVACHSKFKNQNVVELLLHFRANVNAADDRGWTPLHEAASTDNAEITTLLLQRSAFPDVASLDGQTPLHRASITGYHDNVKALLDFDADMDATDQNGLTPLHAAVETGHAEVIRLLLERRASVHNIDIRGWTVLHRACVSRCSGVSVVRCLLKHGADPDLPDLYGHTPLYLACKEWFHNKALALFQHGACVVMPTLRKRDTVLHLLCRQATETEFRWQSNLHNQFKITDQNKRLDLFSLLFDVLSEVGEVDMVNSDCETPYSLWTRAYACALREWELSAATSQTLDDVQVLALQVHELMQQKYHFRLQCIVARSIVNSEMPLGKKLPDILLKMLSRHSAAEMPFPYKISH